MTMMVKDEWIRAAITDDNVVVELLVRLKQAQAAPPAPKSGLPALRWGIRQPRSRSMLLRCDAKRDGDFNVSARGSPTTPLCWSGGSGDASPSAADGFEETSKHVIRSPPVAPSRSKREDGYLFIFTISFVSPLYRSPVPVLDFYSKIFIPVPAVKSQGTSLKRDFLKRGGHFGHDKNVLMGGVGSIDPTKEGALSLLVSVLGFNDNVVFMEREYYQGTASSESNRTSTKRSRRKKTFAELKEEENLLLKERVHLEKEIASTRATCKEHRATNENLKRIRLDLNMDTVKNSSLIADESEKVPCLRVPSSSDSTLPPEALDDDRKPSLDSCNVGKVNSSEKSVFMLPDLNMMPAEDDSCPAKLYWTS
ncbi:hypothetical protein Gotur_000691 [Gossypium turneri]